MRVSADQLKAGDRVILEDRHLGHRSHGRRWVVCVLRTTRLVLKRHARRGPGTSTRVRLRYRLTTEDGTTPEFGNPAEYSCELLPDERLEVLGRGQLELSLGGAPDT